jgi:YidC/Oxa1 family membrane protein insertase
MRDDNTRNTIIFFVCAALLLLVYQVFVIEPQAKRQAAERARQAPAAAASLASPNAPQLPVTITRQAAVEASPRVPIATPSLKGSLSLRGARIDDLFLVGYRQDLDKDSPAVELLRPSGTQFAWFADLGWTGANVPGLPNADTVWTLTQGSTLAPGQPVTLTYSNGQGLTFTRVIAVDDKFMFTVTDTVANTTGQPITLAPYGSVQRQGIPPELGKNGVVHEGGMGWLAGERRPIKYKKWEKDGGGPPRRSTGGWIGITDHYWLAALIPDQREQIDGQYRVTKTLGPTVYDANFVGQPRAIPADRQISTTTRVFAGAKKVPILREYQTALGVQHLDEAVDWGMLWFLTRPVFELLSWLYKYAGNMGVAILALTVIVRLVFFPLANKQYESMTKMKKVQPAMEELRAKYKDDPAKQQQELLALYQREKVNPLAGCLPIFLQIPVFFSLFKVLQVTLEMRHAPFILWIRDLSARDPTTIWNLFGAIPWDPSTAPFIGAILATSLHIGVLPILYGVTTWLTTSMSPPAPDPTQQRIFQLMPLLFTFIMAQFAIGLLVYYTWSNILTAIQQYVIMRRFKVDNPIDKLIARFTNQGKALG